MRAGDIDFDPGEGLTTAYPCGPIERDGAVVGVWYVARRSGPDALAARMWREADGTMAAESAWVSPGAPLGELRRLPQSHDRDFGFHLFSLLANTGAHEGVPHDHVDLARDAGETLREADRTLSREDSEAIAARHLAPALAAAARPFTDSLDPHALALFRRFPDQRWWLGAHWDALEGGPGAPLADALALHPGFPRTVCDLIAAVGKDALARHVADGRLWDAVSVLTRRSHRIVTGIMTTAREAEAALAGTVAGCPARANAMRGAKPALLDLFAPTANESEWPVGVARWTALFPPDWKPSGTTAWWAFARLVPVMDALRRRHGADVPLERILPSGGDWPGLLTRLHAAAGMPPPDGDPHAAMGQVDGLLLAMRGVGDAVLAYSRQVLLAALASEGMDRIPTGTNVRLERAAVAILEGGRTLARTLEVSTDWHRRIPAAAAALAGMPGAHSVSYAWPAGIPDAAFDGVEVRVLTDTPSLVAEGCRGPDADGVEGLDNCLAGYGEACMSGRVRVVSLRRRGDGRTERLSAAELDTGRGSPTWRSLHAGPRNGPPLPAATAALSRYVEGLRSGALPHDPEALAAIPVPHASEVVAACGFDPTVEATRFAVARAWDRHVPRPLRGLDTDGVRAACDAAPAHGWPERSHMPDAAERREDEAAAPRP